MSQLVVLLVALAGALALLVVGLTPSDLEDGAFSKNRQIAFVAPFRYNAPGDDWRNLNEEIVTLQNEGEETLDLSGWTLRNEMMTSYEFPQGFVLAPGASVTIRSGCGDNTAADLYWCSDGPVWDDNKGVATLVAGDGTKAAIHAYERLCETCGDKK